MSDIWMLICDDVPLFFKIISETNSASKTEERLDRVNSDCKVVSSMDNLKA